MAKKVDKAAVKKQIEYYLSDKNLSNEDFFREKIAASKMGYIDLQLFLNCNKVKNMGIDIKDVVDAWGDSETVELSKDKKMIRRMKNKELPARNEKGKKRDIKGQKKEEGKAENAENGAAEDEGGQVVQRDEQGRIIFVPQDFDMENTLILHFITKDHDQKADENYKVAWKDIEKLVKEQYDKVKVTYSRGDKYEGHLSVSTHKSSKQQIEQLANLKGQLIGTKKFDFSKLEGEDLKDFWQKQGGHFNYCIAPKLRLAKKNNRKTQDQKRDDKAKKQKKSYTIAGVYYMDINKVKSKARAILNNMKDDDKLSDNDADFLKEIVKFHQKADEKLKDYDGFVVGPHPEYPKTRCFFVIRKDGTKEDFSVSKCI